MSDCHHVIIVDVVDIVDVVRMRWIVSVSISHTISTITIASSVSSRLVQEYPIINCIIMTIRIAVIMIAISVIAIATVNH